jgi:hypothetical protein
MTENVTVLHDEAIPVTATQKGSVGGVEVPPLNFGSPVPFISGRIELDITSYAHTGSPGEVRMLKGPTIPTMLTSEFRWSPDVTVTATGVQILTYAFTNVSPEEVSPGQLSQFAQFELVAPVGVSIDLKAAFFEGTAFIVQSKVAPVLGANVYTSISDAEARLALAYPNNVSLSALPEAQKGPTLIKATARLEQEVVRLCQPRGSSLFDPATQTLLWPRLNAYSAIGPIIVDWLDSWEDAILLYADEIAEALLLGEDADEPAEDAGLVEVQLDAGGAQYRERWGADGSSADFFQSRQKIFSLLVESFPFGGAG